MPSVAMPWRPMVARKLVQAAPLKNLAYSNLQEHASHFYYCLLAAFLAQVPANQLGNIAMQIESMVSYGEFTAFECFQ